MLAGYPHGQILGFDENGMPVMADEYDSEEDSDYETEGGCQPAAQLGAKLGAGGRQLPA
jgi:hypothetical protein